MSRNKQTRLWTNGDLIGLEGGGGAGVINSHKLLPKQYCHITMLRLSNQVNNSRSKHSSPVSVHLVAFNSYSHSYIQHTSTSSSDSFHSATIHIHIYIPIIYSAYQQMHFTAKYVNHHSYVAVDLSFIQNSETLASMFFNLAVLWVTGNRLLVCYRRTTCSQSLPAVGFCDQYAHHTRNNPTVGWAHQVSLGCWDFSWGGCWLESLPALGSCNHHSCHARNNSTAGKHSTAVFCPIWWWV